MILGLETSTPMISVAVWREGVVRAEVVAESRGRQPLLLLIEEALSLAEVERADLGGVAYARGPGSFTGLRVGLSTAKGLAYALSRPLVGVSSLLGFASQLEGSPLVAPLLDAKKGEVYGALFRGREALLAERAAKPAEMARLLSEAAGGPFLCLGDGAALLAPFLGSEATLLPRAFPRAAEIARLGAERILLGESESPVSATPTYLRRSEAEEKGPPRRLLRTPED